MTRATRATISMWRGYSPAATPPGVCDVAGALSPAVTFTFKLEKQDGTPADPPTVELGVYLWNPGDTITERSWEKSRHAR